MLFRMKTPAKILLTFWFLLLFFCGWGQMQEYGYQRELIGVSGQWHRIILPDEIFGKVASDLSDIRIFGIATSGDTVEAPYLLQVMQEKESYKDVPFQLFNRVETKSGFSYTFEVKETTPVNQVKLKFRQQNFDWMARLEGSNDQQEWVTIIKDYRILSIKNELTDFQFTTLNIPDSKYRYYRLVIDAEVKPDLVHAEIRQHVVSKGLYKDYAIYTSGLVNNRQLKQSEIDVELKWAVPVDYIKVMVSDSIDYYRPITIKYLADSFKTKSGRNYIYHALASGILNSLDSNGVKFNSTIVQKLKIEIHNADNQPLHINGIGVRGSVHQLLARFTPGVSYYLVYGNKNASAPDYDLNFFADKIPEFVSQLSVGSEKDLRQLQQNETSPLFVDQRWMWGIIIVSVLLLGWFSLKMIRDK